MNAAAHSHLGSAAQQRPPDDDLSPSGVIRRLAASAPAARDDERRLLTAQLSARLREDPPPDVLGLLRQSLILVNMPLAESIAARYRGRGESTEDLAQVAYLGLIKAVDGFDPHRGHDFFAYASPTISGEIKRHFRDRGWDIRPPRRVQELRVQVERAGDELMQRLDRSPTVSEIAERLGVSAGDVSECLASNDFYHVHSTDSLIDGAEVLSLADTLGDLDPALERIVDLVSVRPLLAAMSARDRRILALRFFGGWTQSQIAAEIGVTQMQVSRLISNALRRLRGQLEAA